MKFIAKTLTGLEEVLYRELRDIGAQSLQKEKRAVVFQGDLSMLYKANLWLRTATRVLFNVSEFKVKDTDELYEHVKAVEWDKLFSVKDTFVVKTTLYSPSFNNSQFISYRVKDAIADYFMEKYEKRPSVSVHNPDIFVSVHISDDDCSIALDSSGDSLHKRGYRMEQTQAPISEILAAGMILMSGWNKKSDFIDPMCGSGTFLIEAAMIALNIPPGIYRKKFAFERWKNFDKDIFEEVFNDDSRDVDFKHKIYGYDISNVSIDVTNKNIASVGLSKYIKVEKRAIIDFVPLEDKAFILTNPPYGKRLRDANIVKLYKDLGSVLKHRCRGAKAWIISSDVDLLKQIGLRPFEKISLLNGDLKCEFWGFDVFEGKRKDFLKNSKDKKQRSEFVRKKPSKKRNSTPEDR